MIVAHNMMAMNASRMYGKVNTSQKKSTEKLSSGYKINRAADDAAGLTISEKMRSLIRGLDQGTDNIQDGISLIQIADGALSEVNTMLHRMTELAVKAANGTNTEADRAAIQDEINEISLEITRIGKSTTFNTMPILDDITGAEDGGKITKLVTSPAAEGGYLTDAYFDGRTNSYFPSAELDFSGINSTNVKDLYNNGFSFICGYGCGETFKFKFVDGDGTQSKRISGTSSYQVDIHGLTKGSDIVAKLVNVAKTNSQYLASPVSGITQIAHRQGLKASGSKLIVVETIGESNPGSATCTPATGFATETQAKTRYPIPSAKERGSIEASSIINPKPIPMVNEFNIQCSNVKDDCEIIRTRRMNAEVIGVDAVDVSTEAGAKDALEIIENASAMISEQRSELGAYQNRLEHSYANNQNKSENTQAAESRLRDTDMAKEMVAYSLNNILAQAGTSMLSQANQSAQNVLSLLQ